MTPPPAAAGRPRFDIADLVRTHRATLEATTRLTVGQRRVLSAMALCRTAELGGHVDVCGPCGYARPAYNSCRNRHCPKCQALWQERWIAARRERLVPVRHFLARGQPARGSHRDRRGAPGLRAGTRLICP